MTSEQDWKETLPPEVYQITRKKGTEPPFSGKYNDFKEAGTFVCACCQTPLFSSDHKYNSGSGWPSFYKAVDNTAVKEESDNTFGMVRTEIVCKQCDAHLGHVFNDGPEPTGMRYCVNSLSLEHQPCSE